MKGVAAKKKHAGVFGFLLVVLLLVGVAPVEATRSIPKFMDCFRTQPAIGLSSRLEASSPSSHNQGPLFFSSGRPPLGVFGEMISAEFGVNVAMAVQENAPWPWSRFFETISASWPAEPPIPSGASFFHSADDRGELTYVGAEVSWGGGIGAAYSQPYFKQFLVELHFDRATLEAFVNHSFFRMIRKGKKPSIDFISWW